MSSTLRNTQKGPSWTEVVLGAVLSMILGGLIGALLLVVKPVIAVKEMPKEADREARAVYYVPGLRDPSKGRSAIAKRTSFAEGQSVTVSEDELNLLAAMPAPAAPAAPGAPAEKKPETPAPAETIVAGAMNFRLRDGVFQISVPVTVNVLGLSPKLIVQSQGAFAKDGDQFAFVPDTFYLGSLPLQRLPFAANYVRNQFLSAQKIPDDVRASWAKLASVTIEGNALKLTMP